MQTAFKIILENGGFYPLKDLRVDLEKRLNFNDYEKATYAKTGYVRWQAILYFYSIDATKAGWLRKQKGVWHVTNEGAEVLKLSPGKFIEEANKKYKEWKEKQEPAIALEDALETLSGRKTITTSYEQAEASAREEIKDYIQALNPYEFQDLVAALLRGMGYYTPFVASQGPDGGIDVLAYKDPIGAEGVKIKVQVKHRKDTKVTNQEISALNGLLRNREVGLIVSSGGFSQAALREMRTSNNHIEKMDLDDFINFWEQYYDKLDEEGQSLLPIRKISFLAPEE